MHERTLSIVKPDAIAAGHAGAILDRLQKAGLRLVGSRMLQLSQAQAEAFYAVHSSRPFYADLVRFMCSGPVLVSVLQGKDAVKHHRDLMGATDPAKAAVGTLRRDFGASIDHNAVHGSDAADTAAHEIAYFFAGLDLQPDAGQS